MATTSQRTDDPNGCPRCGSPLGASSGRSSIDGPLQPCPRCGGIVLRDGSNEWDLLGSGKKTAIVARRAFAALTIGLIGPLAYLGAAVSSGRDWQPRYALLSLAIGWVLAGSWQASSLLARIRRSRRRMGDPMYLAKLVESEMAAITRR